VSRPLPVPEFCIVVRLEGDPEPRLIAFSEGDLNRLKLWLRESPALAQVAEVALVVLADLLAEETHEAARASSGHPAERWA
jgi:hypothetical protein